MSKKNKSDNLFEKRITENKRIHDELFRKEMENLNEVIRSEKYNVDTMIAKSKLGNVYHDLIDSKDKLNSEYQTKYNQTYHSIDIELHKLNKKIDNETKLINYNYNNKKEKVLNDLRNRIVGWV